MERKNEPRNKGEPKKVWVSPTLTIFGSVESLTEVRCRDKGQGLGDGMSGQGQPYTDICS